MWSPRRLFPPSKRKLPPILPLLCLAWVVLIIYFDWIRPAGRISACRFPHLSHNQTNVVLIADPQLIDDHTYPGRSRFVQSVAQWAVDRYLAKTWRHIHQRLDVDAALFLGDLFDGGRQWDDPAFFEELERWNSIYPKPANKITNMAVAGNHDIGFGDSINLHALQRFQAVFGKTNDIIELGGHNFVILDTISMANSENPEIYEPPFEFLDTVSSLDPDKPKVLLTHVPLYRPSEVDCGKHREKKKGIPYQKGYQYLTLVRPDHTDMILRKLRPVAVFSGDDHDACHVTHSLDDIVTDEYTVKSASMAMGIAAPGFQLVSLDANLGLKTAVCYQANPITPYIVYCVFLFISLLLILQKQVTAPLLPIVKEKVMKPHSWLKKGLLDLLVMLVVIASVQLVVGSWIYADV